MSYVTAPPFFKGRLGGIKLIFPKHILRIYESLKIKVKVKTFSEAEERAQNLRKTLLDRKIHSDVLTFCKAELLVDNYFHAVFEATKSIAEKIRIKTNLTADGSELVDQAFSYKGKIPYLALNNLTTESHESEQKGFMNLLKGVFGTFRMMCAEKTGGFNLVN